MSAHLNTAAPIAEPDTHHLRIAIRLILFYSIAVAYELTLKYSLDHFISHVYGYMGFAYDHSQEDIYLLVGLLTPLALLPMGTKIRQASQFMFLTFATFLLLPTPIYFISHVPPTVFFPIYACLWISTAILAWCSRIALPVALKPLKPGSYRFLIWALALFFICGLAYGATQNLRLVSFADIYKVRESTEYASNFVVRIVHMYIFSLGGLLFAIALEKKRHLLAFIAIITYLICYLESQLKTAALAPLWVIYIYFSYRLFFKEDAIKYFLTLTAPFFLGATSAFLFPSGTSPTGDNLLVYAYTNIVNFRMYSVPNLALDVYYDFFQTHPVTHWSHISIISEFFRYPYGKETMAEVMDDTYGLGNYNASFLSSDAIGAYGYQAIPLAGMVMGSIFIVINSASRGIGIRFLATVMIMPSILFLERPMATCLLTGGVLFLIPYLALMPRTASGTWPQAS